jgi:hypothetical protein
MNATKTSTAALLYEIEQLANRMGWEMICSKSLNRIIGEREVKDSLGNLYEFDLSEAEELLKLTLEFTRKIEAPK